MIEIGFLEKILYEWTQYVTVCDIFFGLIFFIVSFRQKLHFMVMWNGTKWQRIKDECETLDGAHSLRNLTVLQCKWFGIYAIAKVSTKNDFHIFDLLMIDRNKVTARKIN